MNSIRSFIFSGQRNENKNLYEQDIQGTFNMKK